ncbi:tetratricopeptide repeat protein [Sphingoaurantiacus capsulatus]|uniref:Tetratricopeptide repeat protein n=1 Tax=Sphingoaurantiacus capsulatus TaxID=1771310 RepID=A0ABV7XD78_9SPHN
MAKYLSLGATAVAAALLLSAMPAQAAVRVLGSTMAKGCYLAAKAERASAEGLKTCNDSLAQEALSRRDQAATKVNRGILKMYDRDYADALEDYEAALAAEPNMAEAHVNRGIAILRLGQPGAAETASAAFTRGIELATEKPEIAHYMRAIANEMLGDAKGAYLDYRRSAELKPSWSDPRNQLQRFRVTKASN